MYSRILSVLTLLRTWPCLLMPSQLFAFLPMFGRMGMSDAIARYVR